MKKKLQNTTNKLIPVAAITALLVIWQIVSMIGLVPKFMLPAPLEVVQAFVGDFPLLMQHTKATMIEAFLGLSIGIFLGFIAAVCMDRYPLVYKGLYPIVVLTQTIPTIAIAPLLVLWMGYDMAPKIMLIVITTFFPITVGLLDGFRSADQDEIDLLKAMGASRMQIFRYMKLPGSLHYFFAGLRISAAYSVVGAVIAEWLGGYYGLGVYMVRVKKSYSFDKMFAVIFFISAISLLLMWLVSRLQMVLMPWENVGRKQNENATDAGDTHEEYPIHETVSGKRHRCRGHT
ncbi:ABC transporter permease [Lachnospiraceae bacterium ZAX-1]